MSSWGLGNAIFEITIFTWVFTYEVQKLSFLKLPYSREFSFQKLTNISYKRSLLTILFQKPASIWVLVEAFNFWLGTYNVPSGSSAKSLTNEARSAEFVLENVYWTFKIPTFRRPFWKLENILSPGGTLQSRARKGSNYFYLCFILG